MNSKSEYKPRPKYRKKRPKNYSGFDYNEYKRNYYVENRDWELQRKAEYRSKNKASIDAYAKQWRNSPKGQKYQDNYQPKYRAKKKKEEQQQQKKAQQDRKKKEREEKKKNKAKK